jgi:hypothetical protein
MKQTLLFALIAFCLTLFSPGLYAQSYRPGFIVKAEGDTAQGLVKYREGKRRYKSCVFKANEASDPQEFKPGDIIAYGITNDAVYESRSFIDDKNKEIKAFAEVLSHGKLSLYEYRDMLFLEKEKGDLKRLAIETSDPGVGGVVGERRTTTASTKHLVLLNSLTYDCPVPEELLMKVLKKINSPNVIAIVEAYNNCKEPNSSITYRQNKPWLAIEKGLLIGTHTASLKRDGPYSIKDANFPVKHNIIVGGHLNLNSPRRSEKLSLQLDAFFSKEHYLGYNEEHGPLITFRNDYDIKMSRLAAVVMARYTLANWKKANPYLAVGTSHNYILSSSAKRRQETETIINNIRQIDTNISEAYLNMRYYTGATGALGTSFILKDKHKMLVQFRYEKSILIADRSFANDGLSMHLDSNNSFYLTAAYIFR